MDSPELQILAASADTRGWLSRNDLYRAGFADHDIACAVRDGRLVRVRRGAYRLSADADRNADFRVLVRHALDGDPSPVLGGPAALLFHGLPSFGRLRVVHACATSRGGRSVRGALLRIARPPDDQLVERDGRLVAGVARAVLDTARLQGLVAGVVAADAALRGQMVTTEELDRVATTMAGLHGAARARECRLLADARSESPGESWSAVVIHLHGIPRPERQQRFSDERGFIGRSDFWWPEQGVIGEFDGRIKYGRANPSGRPPEDVLWDEKLREDRLRATGSTVVRWVVADLRQPAAWIARLQRVLR